MSPDRDGAPGLVEPEGVNAASTDPEREDPDDEDVLGAQAMPPDTEDGAPAGDSILAPPEQHPAGPGQELSAGEG